MNNISNDIKQSKKKKPNIFLVIIVIIVLCTIGVISFLAITNNNSSNKNNTKETLDVNSNLIKQLYSMVSIFNNIDTNPKFLYYFYQKNSYTASSIDNEAKIALGLNQARDLIVKSDTAKATISASNVAIGVKKVFGPSATYKNASLIDLVDCMSFNYDSKSKTYTGSVDGCGGIVLDSLSTKLISALKIGNKLEITDKFAYVSWDMFNNTNTTCQDTVCPHTYSIYSDINKKNKIASNLTDNQVSIDSIVSNYGSILQTHKYTFTLGSDGNYYFTSVELVK